jgi:hypothetical protein
MDEPNPYESPKADTTTPNTGVSSSHVVDNNRPTLDSVSKWALVGTCCGVVTPLLSVALVFSHGRLADECDGTSAFMSGLFSVVLTPGVGAVIGAMAGFLLRHRKRRDDPQMVTTPSSLP